MKRLFVSILFLFIIAVANAVVLSVVQAREPAAATDRSASFDCANAQSKAEHLVCDKPKLSEMDNKLDYVYRDVLSKADNEQKKRVIAEQRHWLKNTRNVCEHETCLKHAYWSRQAALETYFEPRAPLYKRESDKTEAIKQVLATAPLYELMHSDKQFCSQALDDLKQMKGIRLVDPVVQVQSYEDPALDPWKKQCQSAPPFNVSYQCERNIVPTDADDVVDACNAGYGLPPFKLYELPPAGASGEKRHIFYNDDAYGPMNRDYRKPVLGGGFAGFRQIHITQCLSSGGNVWGHGQKEVSTWAKTSTHADAGRGDRNGKKYNSIIEYKNQYYFFVLQKKFGSYWLEIKPGEARRFTCSWSPVKS